MCTSIVVGRNRSATGSVLLAHSEELGRNSAHKVELVPARAPSPDEGYPLYSGGSLPQPPALARHLATKVFDKAHYPGEHTSGVNEHGVAVANNMALMRGIPEAEAYDVVPGGVIWTEFLQLVLERARTAREGVELVGDLCGKHRLSCDSGTMIAVADPREAWWIELARDGQWIAQRVGDDEIVMRANCYRIGVVDFQDTANVLYAPGLVAYARERGWYQDGPFDFAAIYGDPDNQGDVYNLGRHEVLEARWADQPKVDAPALMARLRDIFEGTRLFKVREDGSPFRTGVRTIARLNTEASTVVELRPDLPAHVGHRLWCSLSTSLTGVYLPFHLGITEVERHYAYAGGSYDPASAYWRFSELSRLADYAYDRCIGTITATWATFEAKTRTSLEAAEAIALSLAPPAACALLTAYDEERAEAALAELEDLLPTVKTQAFFEAF